MTWEAIATSFWTGMGIGFGIFIIPFVLALLARVICVRLTVATEDCNGEHGDDR